MAWQLRIAPGMMDEEVDAVVAAAPGAVSWGIGQALPGDLWGGYRASAMPRRLSVEVYVEGVRAGDRTILGRAITLIESKRADDQVLARQVIDRLLSATGSAIGSAHRVGITGVPGAGKSTFIEALGGQLCAAGHRLAVLAVDPSSSRSGGSILGDKTRMELLARNPRAFVRPSPSLGALGGVARHTRETMLLCEAAGYDIVFVETVGVGQSEVMVAHLVDTFVLLMIPGAGDELQGIKRGIFELADLLVVNKADGEGLAAAAVARRDYAAALHLMQPRVEAWRVPARMASARTGEGLDLVWQEIQRHREALEACGEWRRARRAQQVFWMWRAIEEGLMAAFRRSCGGSIDRAEDDVQALRRSPDQAAAELVAGFVAERDS